MQIKMKASNAILGVLIIAFAIISVSFVFDLGQISSLTTETPGPSIIEIREHNSQPISHGAPDVGCADCHIDQLDEYKVGNRTICTILCHYEGGMAMEPPHVFYNASTLGGNVTMVHHIEDEYRPGFNSCLSSRCHEDPTHEDDMRYAIIVHESDHELCDLCHTFGGHGD